MHGLATYGQQHVGQLRGNDGKPSLSLSSKADNLAPMRHEGRFCLLPEDMPTKVGKQDHLVGGHESRTAGSDSKRTSVTRMFGYLQLRKWNRL